MFSFNTSENQQKISDFLVFLRGLKRTLESYGLRGYCQPPIWKIELPVDCMWIDSE